MAYLHTGSPVPLLLARANFLSTTGVGRTANMTSANLFKPLKIGGTKEVQKHIFSDIWISILSPTTTQEAEV